MDIAKLANLAKLKIDSKEKSYFQAQFTETLKIINQFKNLNTANVPPTYSVTRTSNVWREDEVDPMRVLTQEEALKNAKKTHNGYFVVDAIFHGN